MKRKTVECKGKESWEQCGYTNISQSLPNIPRYFSIYENIFQPKYYVYKCMVKDYLPECLNSGK